MGRDPAREGQGRAIDDRTRQRRPRASGKQVSGGYLDGERRGDELELTLSPSVKGEQKLGEGTMELPLALKARVVAGKVCLPKRASERSTAGGERESAAQAPSR